MANFMTSTQYLHWLFTQESLAAARAARDANYTAAKRARGVADTDTAGTATTGEAEVTKATLQLKTVCEKAMLPAEATATAITLFKRFYVHNSPVQYPPAEMLPAAAFVGVKVEACPYREVQPFTSRLVAVMALPDTEELVKNEMGFLLGVKFHLAVHHPFVSLRGFLRQLEAPVTAALPPAPAAAKEPTSKPADASTAGDDAGGDSDGDSASRDDVDALPRGPSPAPATKSGHAVLEELFKRAMAVATWGLTSDTPLLHTPGQIALAALGLSANAMTGRVGTLPALPDPVPTIVSTFVETALSSPTVPTGTVVTRGDAATAAAATATGAAAGGGAGCGAGAGAGGGAGAGSDAGAGAGRTTPAPTAGAPAASAADVRALYEQARQHLVAAVQG